MVKRIKKGKKGAGAQYITRSNAIRKLQLPLQDFRRLCILKGVYPREPKKKLKGSDKTYFHMKDLTILEHDTLLQKFRDIKAHLKKYKKFQGKKEFRRAEEHMQEKPRYTLSHVIKERYPTFIDALRDLDDALCLVSLFASFPQHQSLEIDNKDVQICQRLYSEWLTYNAIAQSYQKCFLSIKGIYFQTEIMGQNITWVSPYQFNQRLPFDLDYKVIGTFKEFYVALLRFVNFKLYKDLGLSYPPKEIQGISNIMMDASDEKLFLGVEQIHGLQKKTQKMFDDNYTQSIEQIGVSQEFKNTPELLQLTGKQDQLKKQRKLFHKCKFLINREVYSVANGCLQYLILAGGGAFHTLEDIEDLSEKEVKALNFTHHIMDRPLNAGVLDKNANIEYVQPQYLVDSMNNQFLLPTSQYRPGIPPPAHLSPFIDNQKEGYVPMRQKEIAHLKGEEVIESSDEEEVEPAPKKPSRKEKAEKAAADAEQDEDDIADGKGDADSSSEEESEEQNQNQLKQDKKKFNAKLKKETEEEQKELAKVLMTNRQRKLYQKMEEEDTNKKQTVSKLKSKRKAIDRKGK